MAKRKTIRRETSLDGAVADGISECESLRDEMTEWRDNLEEKLSATQKYSDVSECADALDNALNSNQPELPDTFPAGLEDKVTWTEFHTYARAQSRATRLDGAVTGMTAVAEAVEAFLEMHDDPSDECYGNTDREAWETYANEVREIVGEIEGVEFPGMYG